MLLLKEEYAREGILNGCLVQIKNSITWDNLFGITVTASLCRAVILMTKFSVYTSQPLKIFIFCCRYIWATSWQNQQSDCALSEDSDQPGHSPSLIRVFAVRTKKAWVLSYPLSAKQKPWSDWVDARADLSLRWVQSFWFCHEVAQLW